MLMAKKA